MVYPLPSKETERFPGRSSAAGRQRYAATTAEIEAETGDSEAKTPPKDPRKDPRVMAALRRAKRGDPAADPFKPVGRSSFLVWLVIAVGGAAAIATTWDLIDYALVQKEASAFVLAFLTSGEVRSELFAKIDGHPQEYLFQALQWAVILSGAAALYYFAVYVVGTTLLRGLGRAGAGFYRGVLRPVGHAIATSSHRTIEQVRRARANRHGPDPDAGQVRR